jgi:hypothetical protein
VEKVDGFQQLWITFSTLVQQVFKTLLLPHERQVVKLVLITSPGRNLGQLLHSDEKGHVQ